MKPVLVRVRCPRCGQVAEYEPTGEELKAAEEKGLSSIAFCHGDHVLVVYFDAEGAVRRTLLFKSAGPAGAVRPGMTFSDLRSLLGDERLALALSALVAGGHVVLASSSEPLALEVSSALRALSAHPDARVEVVEGPEELRSLQDRPPGTIIVVSKDVLARAGNLGRAVVIDLEERGRPKLTRKEKKGLKALLKALEEAGSLEGEGAKVAFLKDKLGRFREFLSKALKALEEHERIGEPALIRMVKPGMKKEELDLLYFMLEEFRGVPVSKKVARGLSELGF